MTFVGLPSASGLKQLNPVGHSGPEPGVQVKLPTLEILEDSALTVCSLGILALSQESQVTGCDRQSRGKTREITASR